MGGQAGAEIRDAILAGKEVTFHEKGINAHGWSGYGYSIVDPETGAGAYLIEGSGNGAILLLLAAAAFLLILGAFAALAAGFWLLAAGAYILGGLVAILLQYASGNGPNPDTAFNECMYVYNTMVGVLLALGAIVFGLTVTVGFVVAIIASFIVPLETVSNSGKYLCTPQQ